MVPSFVSDHALGNGHYSCSLSREQRGMRMRRPLMAVEVAGESMLPALRPGDRLLVRPGARIGAGDIVIARHPLQPGRLIVKRVTHRAGDGLWLESDNQRPSGPPD